MKKASFVLIAVSMIAIVNLAACADLDKLDGTRTADNLPAPRPAGYSSDSSEDSQAEIAKSNAIWEEDRATHGAATDNSSKPKQ